MATQNMLLTHEGKKLISAKMIQSATSLDHKKVPQTDKITEITSKARSNINAMTRANSARTRNHAPEYRIAGQR